MAELRYDVTDVEAGADFSIPFPIGPYAFKVEEIELTESGNTGEDMLKIVLVVRKGDHKGRKIWEYIVLDGNQDFRLKGFIEGLGIKEKGTIKQLVAQAEGALLDAVVKIEGSKDDEYGEQNKVKNFIPKDGDAAEEAEEPEEEETEEAEEPAAEESGDDDYTWDDLKDLDHSELSDLVSEWGADTDADEYDDDTVEDFAKALAAEYEIEVPKKKAKGKKAKGKKGKAKKEETPDFSEMSLAELKEKCEEKELSPKGTKKVLIKRLEKAAASGGSGSDEPF